MAVLYFPSLNMDIDWTFIVFIFWLLMNNSTVHTNIQ